MNYDNDIEWKQVYILQESYELLDEFDNMFETEKLFDTDSCLVTTWAKDNGNTQQYEAFDIDYENIIPEQSSSIDFRIDVAICTLCDCIFPSGYRDDFQRDHQETILLRKMLNVCKNPLSVVPIRTKKYKISWDFKPIKPKKTKKKPVRFSRNFKLQDFIR